MSEPTRLHDDDVHPFGKFKGDRLGDVPDWWFSWFLRQDWCDEWPDLVQYANLVAGDPP